MLVWLGQAVNSSVAPIRTKKTAAFFNTIMASPLMFVVISGEAMMIAKPSTDYTDGNTNLCNLWIDLFSKPANRASGKVHPNALHLRVQIKRVPAHLAAVARLFITTEGRRCIEHVVSIDPNNTRLDLFRETVRARDVSGPNPGGQAVDRVVCLLEQIVFVFETDHRHDWTKNLFLRHAHAVLHFRKDRRAEEV